MTIASLEDVATQMGQVSKLVRLLASSGITSEHLQLAINNKSARASLAEHLKQGCPVTDYTQPVPKAKSRKLKLSAKTFDEVSFYQTRPGLWVDSDLERYIGLQKHATRGVAVLKKPRVLTQNDNEATMFGALGSDKHILTLANAVDLGQIAGKIEAQWDGEVGELLTDGSANIFPVRGLDGTLRVVVVNRRGGEWDVRCAPFRAGRVWGAGDRVFSN